MVVLKRLVLIPAIMVFAASGCAMFDNYGDNNAVEPSPDEEQEVASVIAPPKETSDKQTMTNPTHEMAEIFNRKIMLLSSQLTTNLKEYDPEMKSMIVTTFVDLDNLDQTSRFGRYVTERLVQEMHRGGYRLFEIRQSQKIKVVEYRGEFHLTRHSSKLLDQYRSDAVIVGTYSVVNGELTLNVRILERDSSRIISVGSISFQVQRDPYAAALLVGSEKPGVMLAIQPLEGK